MPDQLNKQAIVNLLIDSPLREPIKINLIDIVNNTSEPDLPKVFPTITKELEIFQKATERRMKLADETIAKLGGSAPSTAAPAMPTPPTPPAPSLPPLDLPPTPPTPPAAPATTPTTPPPTSLSPLSVPPLDLPPLPVTPVPSGSELPNSSEPTVAPTLAATPATPATGDEAALAEIQKELDSLKTSVTADAAPATPAPQPTV